MTSAEAVAYLQPIAESSHLKTYADAIDLAIKALRLQQTQENIRKMLSLDELTKMGSTPVWIVEGTDGGHWELSEDGLDYLEDREPALYGISWWAYRQKKEKSDG